MVANDDGNRKIWFAEWLRGVRSDWSVRPAYAVLANALK
jgi:hypothetical protein